MHRRKLSNHIKLQNFEYLKKISKILNFEIVNRILSDPQYKSWFSNLIQKVYAAKRFTLKRKRRYLVHCYSDKDCCCESDMELLTWGSLKITYSQSHMYEYIVRAHEMSS